MKNLSLVLSFVVMLLPWLTHANIVSTYHLCNNIYAYEHDDGTWTVRHPNGAEDVHGSGYQYIDVYKMYCE